MPSNRGVVYLKPGMESVVRMPTNAVDAIEKLQAAGLVSSLIVGSFETSVLT